MVNLAPFLIYVTVTTFTPGPNNILSMTNGLRYGYRRSLPFLAGIFAGFVIIMLLSGWLNVALVSLLPQVRVWLEVLGAVYMLYLAVHTLLSKPAEEVGVEPGKAGMNTFKAGVWMQFLNVKVILYGITVYSTFITQVYADPLRASLFAPVLAGVGFVATSCWALGGSIFREAWQSHYRAFNLAMAALLVYTAAASVTAIF